MDLIVDRKKWARGVGGRMLRSNGCYCILGLVAKQCGFKDKHIAMANTPYQLRAFAGSEAPQPSLPVQLLSDGWRESDLSRWAMYLNDHTNPLNCRGDCHFEELGLPEVKEGEDSGREE